MMLWVKRKIKEIMFEIFGFLEELWPKIYIWKTYISAQAKIKQIVHSDIIVCTLSLASKVANLYF